MIDPRELDLPIEPPPRTYRIGVIGAGGITANSHLPAYRSQGWEVVRIASRSEGAARDLAERFGIPRHSASFDDVINDPAVEVVDISLPPHLHREVCERAFAAKKHVLLQKPMSTTLSDARAIVAAAGEAGVRLCINQNGRWDPAIRACKELIGRGTFGSLVTASMELRTRQPWQKFWEDAEHYPRLMILGMSIHHLDQFRFLFGEPKSICAVTQRYPGQPWPGESIAFYALKYSDEFTAFGLDDGFPWTRDWSVKYRLEGTAAIAMGDIGWPTGGYSTLRYTEAAAPDSWVEPALTRKWFPDAFAGTMGALFTAIATGTDATISGKDNLSTMRLVEAAYLSAREGRTVQLEELSDQ